MQHVCLQPTNRLFFKQALKQKPTTQDRTHQQEGSTPVS